MFSLRTLSLLTAFFFVTIGPSLSHAQNVFFPKSMDEAHRIHKLTYQKPIPTTKMYKLKGAEAVWVNYKALRRDIEFLEPLNDFEIKSWIVENFAWVSEEQLLLQGLRVGEIPLELGANGKPIEKQSYRPGNFERATLEVSMSPDHTGVALFEVKGNGQGNNEEVHRQLSLSKHGDLDKIRIGGHNDGSMSLGEAIAEVTRQQAAQMIFDIERSKNPELDLQTVDSYFIIDPHYDILKDKNQSIPAGYYGRQPTILRTSSRLLIPDNLLKDPHGGKQRDYTGMALVDFGGVIFSQPELQEKFGPLNELAPKNGSMADAQRSKPWAHGHDAARNYKNGDRLAIIGHIEYMLEPLEGPWKQALESEAMANRRDAQLVRAFENGDVELALNIAREVMGKDYDQDTTFLRLTLSILIKRLPPEKQLSFSERFFLSPEVMKTLVYVRMDQGLKRLFAEVLPESMAQRIGAHVLLAIFSSHNIGVPAMEHVDNHLALLRFLNLDKIWIQKQMTENSSTLRSQFAAIEDTRMVEDLKVMIPRFFSSHFGDDTINKVLTQIFANKASTPADSMTSPNTCGSHLSK